MEGPSWETARGPDASPLVLGSVPEAVEWCGDMAPVFDEHLAAVRAGDVGDGPRSEQAAEIDVVPHGLAWHRNHTYGGGFPVGDTDRGLIHDDAADGRSADITWEENHVQAYGADRRHGFELLHGEVSLFHGLGQHVVLHDRQEGAGQPPHGG